MGIYTGQHTVVVNWSCNLSETLQQPQLSTVSSPTTIFEIIQQEYDGGLGLIDMNIQNLKPGLFS